MIEADSGSATSDTLDDLLVRIYAARQRPCYRRRILDGIDTLNGVGGVRVLRAIERQLYYIDRATVGDVAADMGVSHSSASRAVDDMSQRGLVMKMPCQDDLRKARLTLSKDGQSVLETANRNRQRLLTQATTNWAPIETARLIDLLSKLLAGYYLIESTADG